MLRAPIKNLVMCVRTERWADWYWMTLRTRRSLKAQQEMQICRLWVI